MYVVDDHTSAEIEEKKSRFICDLFYVADVKEAEEKIAFIKKKYYDAKHHCFAYIIGEDKSLVKSSDDGEPSGTAGHPMLDILKGHDITNVIAIVTRYFGGTLLGTGGLVSAYSGALNEALKSTKLYEVKSGYEVEFFIDYDNYNVILKDIRKYNEGKDTPAFIELSKEFGEKISIKLVIEDSYFDNFSLSIKNLTKGNTILEKGKNSGRKYIWKNLSYYNIW